MQKMKTWAPWHGEDQKTGKESLLRFVTCCIIVTNLLIIIFGIAAATRAANVRSLTKV